VTIQLGDDTDDMEAASSDELDVQSAAADDGGGGDGDKRAGCKELEWDDSTLSY